MNNATPINSFNHEEALYKELNELFLLNEKLIRALQDRRNEVFPPLLDQRNNLSQKIEELSRQKILQENEMSDETKMLAAKVLMQDRELMIHLELEVQKLRGKYQKLQMLAQKKISAR